MSLMSLSLLLHKCSPCVVQGWFVRSGADSHTAAILWGIAPKIYTKQLTAFLCSSHQAFSLCVLLAFRWCIHIVVWTQQQLGRNPVLFYQINQISIWLIMLLEFPALTGCMVGLVGFYGISTLVCDLMPNPVYTYMIWKMNSLLITF